jgi:hypothetical protein
MQEEVFVEEVALTLLRLLIEIEIIDRTLLVLSELVVMAVLEIESEEAVMVLTFTLMLL